MVGAIRPSAPLARVGGAPADRAFRRADPVARGGRAPRAAQFVATDRAWRAVQPAVAARTRARSAGGSSGPESEAHASPARSSVPRSVRQRSQSAWLE